MEPPSTSMLTELMEQLRDASRNLPNTQERLMSLTGVGWSADRTVKVEVGPRGQLVDVQIDPKVFRRPDAYALRGAIIAANAAAVRTVLEKTREVMEEQLPPELNDLRAQLRPGEPAPTERMLRTDAEILSEREGNT